MRGREGARDGERESAGECGDRERGGERKRKGRFPSLVFDNREKGNGGEGKALTGFESRRPHRPL